jgi:hypothetical protein
MGIRSLRTKAEVHALVDHLRDSDRSRPLVLISTPNRNPIPLISISEVESVAGHIADIVLIETGPLTFEFTDRMVHGTQVYGGAGRVYPVGTDWEQDLHLSPLRFAYEPVDGPRAAKRLIEDAFQCHRGDRSPAALVQRLGDDNAAALAAARTLAVAATKSKTITDADLTVAVMTGNPTLTIPSTHVPRPGLVKVSPAEPAPTAPPVAPAAEADGELVKLRRLLAAAEAELEAARQSAATDRALADARLELATTTTGPIPIQKPRDQQPVDANYLLVENATLVRQLAENRAKHAEQLAAARKKPSKAADCAVALTYNPELFTDADDAVRHAITQMWVQRVPATEKAQHQLGEYLVGPAFAESLEKLDDGQLSKAFRCVVDVITDLARNLPARRVHVLRNGIGGDDQAMTRWDGAVCFRASIEKNTASARRLHYWKHTDGTIELSRIVTHEDMQP